MGDLIELSASVAAGILMAASILGTIVLLGAFVSETQGERAGAVFLLLCALAGAVVTGVVLVLVVLANT